MAVELNSWKSRIVVLKLGSTQNQEIKGTHIWCMSCKRQCGHMVYLSSLNKQNLCGVQIHVLLNLYLYYYTLCTCILELFALLKLLNGLI